MTESTSTNEVQILEDKVSELVKLVDHVTKYWTNRDQTKEDKKAMEAENAHNLETVLSFALSNFPHPTEDDTEFPVKLRAIFRNEDGTSTTSYMDYRNIPVTMHPAVIPVAAMREILSDYKVRMRPLQVPSYRTFADLYADAIFDS